MPLSDSAQNEMRVFARARIGKMGSSWGMWALTKEAFLLQVFLLLELCGDDINALRIWAAKLTDNGMTMGQKLDETFAQRVVEDALRRIDRL